ncbi:hypothetical protein GCM10022237_25650 [Nocardioides ginsengisoli]|uniref:Uncharacterized protein n=1 Tax=Nocardioides ginsengisoli TaxID=363868 RepID=A0ABW3W7H9_9ACTN
MYSVALDHGIDPKDWVGHEDEPVPVKVDLLLKPDLQAIAYFRVRGGTGAPGSPTT